MITHELFCVFITSRNCRRTLTVREGGCIAKHIHIHVDCNLIRRRDVALLSALSCRPWGECWLLASYASWRRRLSWAIVAVSAAALASYASWQRRLSLAIAAVSAAALASYASWRRRLSWAIAAVSAVALASYASWRRHLSSAIAAVSAAAGGLSAATAWRLRPCCQSIPTEYLRARTLRSLQGCRDPSDARRSPRKGEAVSLLIIILKNGTLLSLTFPSNKVR